MFYFEINSSNNDIYTKKYLLKIEIIPLFLLVNIKANIRLILKDNLALLGKN